MNDIQTKSGTRGMLMPGARSLMTVTMMLNAEPTEPMPSARRPRAQ